MAEELTEEKLKSVIKKYMNSSNFSAKNFKVVAKDAVIDGVKITVKNSKDSEVR